MLASVLSVQIRNTRNTSVPVKFKVILPQLDRILHEYSNRLHQGRTTGITFLVTRAAKRKFDIFCRPTKAEQIRWARYHAAKQTYYQSYNMGLEVQELAWFIHINITYRHDKGT